MSHSAVHIRDTGLTVVYQPPGEVNAIADLILVHGLQGHPRRTWQTTSSTARESRRPRINLFGFIKRQGRSRSPHPVLQGAENEVGEQAVYWPRDLLPLDCPNVRVIVWGYDSMVSRGYQPANKSNLFSHADSLLNDLARERSLCRPIIFLAHSLGGLVVKETLRRSEEDENIKFQDIIGCTKAIVFFGTPHRGSADFAQLGDTIRRVASKLLRVDSNAPIIRALGVDSPELELSRKSFIRQWRKFDFQVKTFQESKPMTGFNVGVLNEKVVPDISSSIDDPREHAEPLNANHQDMARFISRNDDNYIKVKGELKNIIDSINDGAQDPQEDVEEKGTDDPLDALAFDMMMNRLHNIQQSLADTCNWFYNSTEYRDWCSRDPVSDDCSLLWIKGKPGSGKSTLMKNAFSRTRRLQSPDANVTAFFFNARGAPLERTSLGLFRSIIHQICRQDPTIMTKYLELYQDRKISQKSGKNVVWVQNELEDFLRQVFGQSKPRKTFIFCDALDECREEEVRKIVYFFSEISKSASARGLILNICLSSRHYPTISTDGCLEVVMERANKQDILKYLQMKFSFIERSEPEIVMRLKEEIYKKASGIFLWAVLVSDLLLQDLETGQPPNVPLQRLNLIPSDMEDLYSKLCNGLKSKDRDLSARLIQWVLLAGPMTAKNFFLAAIVSKPWTYESLHSWEYTGAKSPPEKRLVKYIRHASGGLIECNTHTGIAQFIHETAREFFLAGNGLKILDPTLRDPPLGYSHLLLIDGCVQILNDLKARPYTKELWDYSQRSIFFHMLKAEEYGVSAEALLKSLGRLEERVNPLPFEVPIRLKGESLLNLSVEIGFKLVKICLRRGDPFDYSGLKSITPLLTAISKEYRSLESASLLLDYLGANVNVYDKDGLTPLILSVLNGDFQLTMILLDAGADMLATDVEGKTALHILARTRIQDIGSDTIRDVYRHVTLRLVEVDEILEKKDNWGSTPLSLASYHGHLELVKLLLSKGVDVNLEDTEGPPLLNTLISNKPEAYDICQILIQHGANVHYTDKRQRTFLHVAARNSTPEIVRLLIDAGINVDKRDYLQKTALHRASERTEPTEMIRILVSAGCSITARNYLNQTPLEVRRVFWPQMSHEERVLLDGSMIGLWSVP